MGGLLSCTLPAKWKVVAHLRCQILRRAASQFKLWGERLDTLQPAKWTRPHLLISHFFEMPLQSQANQECCSGDTSIWKASFYLLKAPVLWKETCLHLRTGKLASVKGVLCWPFSARSWQWPKHRLAQTAQSCPQPMAPEHKVLSHEQIHRWRGQHQ